VFDRTDSNEGFMKIALAAAVMVLLASLPAHAQGVGGSLRPPQSFQTLPWNPPASPQAIELSGTDETFLPSTFLTFESAVAAGKAVTKEKTKSVAEAAAESRKGVKTAAKIRIEQDDRGNLVLALK
jgi:hypothetical protein